MAYVHYIRDYYNGHRMAAMQKRIGAVGNGHIRHTTNVLCIKLSLISIKSMSHTPRHAVELQSLRARAHTHTALRIHYVAKFNVIITTHILVESVVDAIRRCDILQIRTLSVRCYRQPANRWVLVVPTDTDTHISNNRFHHFCCTFWHSTSEFRSENWNRPANVHGQIEAIEMRTHITDALDCKQ